MKRIFGSFVASSGLCRSSTSSRRSLHTSDLSCSKNPDFSLILDIDGVICRGRDVLPGVKEAFSLITDTKGRFSVPTVFLTNGSNSLRAAKAAKLTELIGVHIEPEQVVMAHSPLKMFSDLHKKHVLVVGQGPVKEIANHLGFHTVTVLDDLRVLFPHLDCVDFKRRKLDAFTQISAFNPIEAIIFLGEPLRWESALQLITDVLITNGNPASMEHKRTTKNYPHIPIVACNMDLLWMAEKGLPLPRFGHGIFLHCLAAVYHKLTGHDLHFEAFLGKPSEISYVHAAHCIQRQAFAMKTECPNTIYVIGDNPESDILGGNLFSRYLKKRGYGRFDHLDVRFIDTVYDSPLFDEHSSFESIKQCIPVLVETGVYHEGCTMNGIVHPVSLLLNELSEEEQTHLRRPAFVEENLYHAMKTISSRHRC
ncbi:hypothetical protein QR680_002472 [Steinernema hermaphroditum]|uniref:Uncharacterized protein n=1 Tax=Steinernema hermaphroditum TaxID=289476 RepID=A0AA39H2U5_9BILA|nr:hypothetical protein QR680_002472 [Steinernema hermaphroditum]